MELLADRIVVITTQHMHQIIRYTPQIYTMLYILYFIKAEKKIIKGFDNNDFIQFHSTK